MNRSNAKIIKGDIKGAIQDLNQVIIIRPHYAGAYLNRGLARFEMNDYASAMRDFDECIKLEPENALSFNNRGIVKQKLEDYNGAIMDYDMALQLDPGMANAYFNRAMAREILKRPGYENDYQIAADLNPQYDLSRYSVRNDQAAKKPAAKSQQNTRAQASATPPPAAKQQENDSIAVREEKTREEELKRRRRMNLILSDNRNLQREKPVEAEDPYVQNKNIQIELQPIFLVTAYDKNTANYEGLQYYNAELEALNIGNNYNPILSMTNRIGADNQKFFKNYILYYNEKLNIAANSLNYLNRGILFLLTENFNQSLADLNKAIELDPTSVTALLSRGNCRYKMIEKVESLSPLPGNLAVNAGSSETAGLPGNKTVQGSSDYDLVLADYSRAISLQPGYFFGFFNRAYMYLRLGKYQSAMDDLNKAIALEPDFAEAFYNRGLTRIYLNDTRGGALDLSKAGELGLMEAYSIIKHYCN
jgi:tetratricopeptide (TPR) repeat protein